MAVGAVGWGRVGSVGSIGSVGDIGVVGRADTELFTQRGFDLVADVLVFLQEDAGVFAALAEALAFVVRSRCRTFRGCLFRYAEVDAGRLRARRLRRR